MPGKSFLRQVAGRFQEILGVQSSSGAPNAGDIPALDSTGKLSITMMPTGVGESAIYCPASENLAAGDFVNIWNDSGTLKARKADATGASKPAQGFVESAYTTGQSATVFLSGTNDQCSGLTVGAAQYLGTTAGLPTATAPSASGNLVQALGVAVSATSMTFAAEERAIIA